MGVCRRVLGNAADAEDAFQATFLVLARRAAFVAWRSSVANWLHVTAYRLARKLRIANSRRRAREQLVAPKVEPLAPAATEWRELCDLLDGELRRLPGAERSALLACYFEGRTQDEAARELGWSLRTLQRRLERGRDLLRARLVRQGLPLPVAFLAGVLLNEVTAAGKAAETARAAVLFATGAAPSVRGAVTTLAVSTLRANARGAFRIAVAALVLLGVCAAGVHFDFLSGEDVESPLPTAVPSVVPATRPMVDAGGDPLPERAIARLGTLRLRHADSVVSVAFARDGQTLVASDVGGNVVLWDVASGWRLRQIRQPARGPATGAAVSADRKILFTEGGHGWLAPFGGGNGVSEWPVDKLAVPLKLRDGKGGIVEIDQLSTSQTAVSADGTTLAVVFAILPSTVGVYDIATGKKRAHLSLPGYASRLAIAPDGATLAFSFANQPAVRLWNVASGKEVGSLTGPKGEGARLAFSPDGKTLAVAAGTLFLWDVNKARELCRAPDANNCQSLAYLPDGKVLATVESNRLIFRNATSGKFQYAAEPVHRADDVVVSPDGRTVATWNGWGTRTIDLWDAATGKYREFPGHRSAVTSLSFSNDGTALLAAEGDYAPPRVWDPATGRELVKVGSVGYSEVIYSPDGKSFAGYQTVTHSSGLWDTSSGKQLTNLTGYSGASRCMSFGAGGSLLLEGVWDGKSARLWDVPKGEMTLEIAIGQDRPAGVVLSPGGAVIAAGGYNSGAVRRWNARTGWELSKLSTPHKIVLTLAIASGGRTLATAGADEPVYLWDTRSLRQLRQLEGLGAGPTQCLAFTADGSRLIGVGGGRARVWEVATGKELERFEGCDCPIVAAAISADGRLAATGGADTTILVWDLTGGKSAARELSPDEMEHAWADLADPDDRTGYHAAGTLAAAPRRALPLLAQRLRPVAVLTERSRRRVATLSAGLDNDSFTEREKATAELRGMGSVIDTLLRAALEGNPSAEVRRRLEGIRKVIAEDPPEWLRTRRALRALERIHSPEARQILERVAAGEPDARPTLEAKAILARINDAP
jgi:RNA polymerase sigma factor (sigma-70 family)